MAFSERFVRADAAGGGDGTTNANSGANGSWTLAEAVANEAAGMRINVKAGTYANTSTSRTLAAVGTTTAPIWWRGFNVAAGDLDNDAATAKPIFTFTTGFFIISGAHHIISNLSVQGAVTTAQVTASGSSVWLHRVRCENTNSPAGAVACNVTGAACRFTSCWFKCPSTATAVVTSASASFWFGCDYTGGGVGMQISTSDFMAVRCVFRATGSHGLELTAATGRLFTVTHCTFRGCGGDGMRFTALPSNGLVANCLFAAITGTAINNASGANTNIVVRIGNDFWSVGTTEAGFGDSPALNGLTESSDPHVSATDLRLVTGAAARAAAQPGLYEAETYTSFPDVGAVQHADPAGGGTKRRAWS
jgi:hypothetical protein